MPYIPKRIVETAKIEAPHITYNKVVKKNVINENKVNSSKNNNTNVIILLLCILLLLLLF